MSGGHFDYVDKKLYNRSEQVRQDGNPLLAELLHDLGDLLHEYDWWISGDTGRERWLEAWTNWQNKWMNGDSSELSFDAITDVLRQMIWEGLGEPDGI